MKLVEKIVYKEVEAKATITDLDKMIEDIKGNKTDPFCLFVEVHEDDTQVTFANVYAFDWDEEYGRTTQVETAILNKSSLRVMYMADNDGFDCLPHLNGKPYWTFDDLKEVGVVSFGDAPVGYQNGRWKHWRNYI